MSNPYYGQFAESGGAVFKSHSREIAYNMQQLLTYTNTFADVHNLDLLFGHEMYNRKSYGLYGSKTMMFSPDNTELSGAVVDSSRSGSSVLEYNNEGYFFRGQYDYDNRIYFSGSYRRDASSRFHPDHRWGNFWSLGAAWIINRESWFNASWVNMLKVKASYGSQGNDNLGSRAESYYRYTDYREILSSGDGVTSVLYQKGNPDITWETNANLNVGVEFGLWDNRLSGSIDVFNRKTTDMLFELATPIESGYTTIFTNIGDMVNRGLEIELNADLIRTKNLVWDFSLNMTHYKNKVTHLPEQFKNNTTADGKHVGRWQDTKFLTEGESVFSFYVPTYAGVDPETGKSLWYTYKTDDAGNKERIKTSDYSVASQEGREMHGDALPDVYGGFGTSLRFYGVDFSIGFTYQLGGQVLDQGYRFYMNSPDRKQLPPRPAQFVDSRELRFEHSAFCLQRLESGSRLGPFPHQRIVPEHPEHHARIYAAQAYHAQVPRRESAYLPRLRQCMVLVQASGSRPASGHQRNHEPVLLRPDSHLLGRCNRNVLIC